MTEAFFAGDYDFLGQRQTSQLPGFYTAGQEWELIEENGRKLWLQDGSKWVPGFPSGMAKFMGKMIGAKYQEFMDNIRAYYYFPLAIARDSSISDASLKVRVKPVSRKYRSGRRPRLRHHQCWKLLCAQAQRPGRQLRPL